MWIPKWRARGPLAILILSVISSSATAQILREVRRRPAPHMGGPVLAMELLDLDGDGDLDFFIGGLGRRTFFGINDGHGHFRDEANARLPVEGYPVCWALAFADVDGDGDLDCYFGNYDTYTPKQDKDRLLLNNGKGYFRLSPGAIPNAAGVQDAKFADVDKDGDPDLLVTSFRYGPNGLLLWLNDGKGRFSDVTVQRLPPAPKGMNSIQVADLDGDGWVDLVMANDLTRPRILMNRGGGYFRDDTMQRFPSTAQLLYMGRCADVDGDGDSDILLPCFVDSHLSSQDRLYINNGKGYFVEETKQRMPVDSDLVLDAQFVDLDRDGDLDLLISNDGVPLFPYLPSKIYLNDGKGRFHDASQAWFGSKPRPRVSQVVRAGDIDGDGDIDVIFAGQGVATFPPLKCNYLYLNHSRQVTAPQVATAGQNWQLQVSGPARSLNWLLLGLAPTVQKTPFGQLGVDPKAALFWPNPLLLPSSGNASFSLPLPLSMKGQRLYAQAAQLDLKQFSRTHFTNTWKELVR